MKDTKNKIITGAVICLNRSINATIDEIASSLGISRRTIHRYFKDRETLIQCCQEEMLRKCNQSMEEAYSSSSIALEQVENMFYAAYSIGVEYSFVKKISARNQYSDLTREGTLAFDNVKNKWFKLVEELQTGGIINSEIPVAWIYDLFGGIIDIAIAARISGDVAVNDLKKLSWIAFKGSVGIIK